MGEQYGKRSSLLCTTDIDGAEHRICQACDDAPDFGVSEQEAFDHMYTWHWPHLLMRYLSNESITAMTKGERSAWIPLDG